MTPYSCATLHGTPVSRLSALPPSNGSSMNGGVSKFTSTPLLLRSRPTALNCSAEDHCVLSEYSALSAVGTTATGPTSWNGCASNFPKRFEQVQVKAFCGQETGRFVADTE